METLISTLTPILTSIVIGLIGWGLTELSKYIRQKTKNERLTAAFDAIAEAAFVSVQELEQTARPLLKDGKLDEEDKATLKAQAIDKVKSRISPAILKEAEKNLMDVDDWIGGQVEATVFQANRTKKGACNE